MFAISLLTNLEFRHFSASKRIPVNLEDLNFGVLDRLFQTGDDYIEKLDKLKAEILATSDMLNDNDNLRKKIQEEELVVLYILLIKCYQQIHTK